MENTLYIKDNMDSPNYEVFYKDNIPSVDHPLHYHDFLEIYYHAEGDCDYIIDSRRSGEITWALLSFNFPYKCRIYKIDTN